MAEANIQDVRKFFSTEEKPVSMTEFKAFWESLSDAEKAEVKQYVASQK